MALVEGNTPDTAVRDANDEQNEQSVAQMFAYMSDRASLQGGKVLDAREMLRIQDNVEGADIFQRAAGVDPQDIIDKVRDLAIERGLTSDKLNIHLVEQIPDNVDKKLLGGQRIGDDIYVRIEGNARPDRSLIHEVAHALTEDNDHGEDWQNFYLDAIERIVPDMHESEQQRVDYKYNKSYLDDED